MSVAIQCPHCGAKLRLKDDAALGKKIKCRITCTPLLSPNKKREGVILLMDEL